jgi:hypothetical protein
MRQRSASTCMWRRSGHLLHEAAALQKTRPACGRGRPSWARSYATSGPSSRSRKASRASAGTWASSSWCEGVVGKADHGGPVVGRAVGVPRLCDRAGSVATPTAGALTPIARAGAEAGRECPAPRLVAACSVRCWVNIRSWVISGCVAIGHGPFTVVPRGGICAGRLCGRSLPRSVALTPSCGVDYSSGGGSGRGVGFVASVGGAVRR